MFAARALLRAEMFSLGAENLAQIRPAERNVASEDQVISLTFGRLIQADDDDSVSRRSLC